MSWRNHHELAPFTPSPSRPPKRQRLTVPKKRKHICEFVFFSHSSTPPPPTPVIAVLDEEFMNLCNCNPPRSSAGAAAVKELLESIDEEWDYFCLKKKAWEMSPSFLQAQTQRKMRLLMSLRCYLKSTERNNKRRSVFLAINKYRQRSIVLYEIRVADCLRSTLSCFKEIQGQGIILTRPTE